MVGQPKPYLVSILNPETGAVLLPPTIYHGRNEVMESLNQFFFLNLHPIWRVPISYFRSSNKPLPDRYHHYVCFRQYHRDATVTFALPPVAWNVIDTIVPPALPPLPEPPLPLFAWNIKDKLMTPRLPPLPEPPLGLDNDYF